MKTDQPMNEGLTLEQELVSQFVLKYNQMFKDDQWFWKQELTSLLVNYKTKLEKVNVSKSICDHPDTECIEDFDGYKYCKQCGMYV